MLCFVPTLSSRMPNQVSSKRPLLSSKQNLRRGCAQNEAQPSPLTPRGILTKIRRLDLGSISDERPPSAKQSRGCSGRSLTMTSRQIDTVIVGGGQAGL